MEPLTIISTLACGIILGYWGHALTSRRDREARAHADQIARRSRLDAYEAFLLAYEQKIEKTIDEATIKAIYYNQAAAEFRSEAAKVRRDFSNRVEFNRLDAALGRITPTELDGDGTKTKREILADAIRPLIRYVQEA
jgi:hypothetical protein